MYWVALGIMFYYLFSGLTPPHAFQLISLQPSDIWEEFVPPAWTLRYEIAFYLVFGLCLLPYIGRPLLCAWVFAVVWHWTPPVLPHFFQLPPMHFLDWIAHPSAGHFFAPFEFYFFAGLLGGWVFTVFAFRRGVRRLR